MFSVELLSQAENELAQAYEWYEERKVGLGNRLYRELNYYLGLIESNPYLFAIKYNKNLRSASLKKFPYLVIFWVEESTRIIYIVSIFHTSKNPRYS